MAQLKECWLWNRLCEHISRETNRCCAKWETNSETLRDKSVRKTSGDGQSVWLDGLIRTQCADSCGLWNPSEPCSVEANFPSHYLLSSLTLLLFLFPFPLSPELKHWLIHWLVCVCGRVMRTLAYQCFSRKRQISDITLCLAMHSEHTHRVMVCNSWVISWNQLDFPLNFLFSSRTENLSLMEWSR